MATTFDGNEGEMILVGDAADMTQAFQKKHPNQKKGYFFGRNKIEDLLNQTGAMGIRIYFGLASEKDLTLVLVAANADVDDNLNNILDTGIGCPDVCSTDNALNS
ncbi:MAG: hypothetical protein NTY88_09245 [Bacteroidetes bacterium]|nr:hypothetical protein [Bacteroidota bacterium]